MADHIQEVHGGIWSKDKPWEDWKFDLGEIYRKPLNRQLGEFLAIRRAKTLGTTILDGKEVNISKNFLIQRMNGTHM